MARPFSPMTVERALVMLMGLASMGSAFTGLGLALAHGSDPHGQWHLVGSLVGMGIAVVWIAVEGWHTWQERRARANPVSRSDP